jgi:hypothetical protein
MYQHWKVKCLVCYPNCIHSMLGYAQIALLHLWTKFILTPGCNFVNMRTHGVGINVEYVYRAPSNTRRVGVGSRTYITWYCCIRHLGVAKID